MRGRDGVIANLLGIAHNLQLLLGVLGAHPWEYVMHVIFSVMSVI